MELVFARHICFLLLAVPWMISMCSTQAQRLATENDCAVHALPTDVIDRLLTASNTTLSLVKSLERETDGSSACKDSPSLDTFSKLLLLLFDKMDKEQARLGKEVATLKEILRQSQEDQAMKPSQCSCTQNPEPLQSSSSSNEVLLKAILQLQQDIRAHIQLKDPTASQPIISAPLQGNCSHSNDRPTNCYELVQQGKNESGVYTIYPYRCERKDDGIRVWCDMEGEDPGWTVVLSRRPLDEQVNFNRGWRDYKIGFGDPQTEHWIGNLALHALTSNAKQMLHIDMVDWDGNQKFAKYQTFIVDDEESEYLLHLGGFTGDAGDALTYHSNMRFTTSDRDNDAHDSNCAILFDGGFWFNRCHQVSPTSNLLPKQKSTKGINWNTWYADRTTLKEMHFKVKPVTCSAIH